MAKRTLTIEIDVPEGVDGCWNEECGGAEQCFDDVVLKPAKAAIERRLALTPISATNMFAYLDVKKAILESITVISTEC